jgi:S1-C subfamily serine protease
VLAEEEEPSEPPDHGIVLFERGLRRSPPAYVERVRGGSPAAAVGLRPDDLIVRVGETPVRTCAQFHAAMARLAPGDRVSLVFKRGSRVLQETITLGEAR